MPASERRRELKRRRKRKKSLSIIARRAEKANSSEKVVLADKVRKLTPGAEELIVRLGLGSD